MSGNTIPFHPESNNPLAQVAKPNGHAAAEADAGRGEQYPSDSGATLQHPSKPNGLTLEQYAHAIQVPLDLLATLGINTNRNYNNGAPAVRILYFNETGNEQAVKSLTACDDSGSFQSRWRKESKQCLYGLWLLPKFRAKDTVVLVNTESDWHVLWQHRVPALGLPEPDKPNEKRDAKHLESFKTILIPVEHLDEVPLWIDALSIRERVRLVPLGGHKNIVELYLSNPANFVDRWNAAVSEAQSLTELTERAVAAERAVRREELWGVCGDLAGKPRILDELARELDRCGAVGEEHCIKLLYLALTSRFLDKPVSIVVKGPSSGGKSYSVEQALKFLPPEAYYKLTSMSEKALIYLQESFSHRFLVLMEAAGLRTDFVQYILRSLLSEGQIRYTVVVPVEDDDGSRHFEGQTVEKQGPTGLITTTTAPSLHRENETRYLSVSIDDSHEQTRRVMLATARTADNPTANSPDPTWLALQQWLAESSHEVSIPYGGWLAGSTPPVAVRLRRDFPALLGLIKAHAILHQASRRRDEHGRIVAEIFDYAVVRELVGDVISEGVEASVAPSIRETVAAVVEVESREARYFDPPFYGGGIPVDMNDPNLPRGQLRSVDPAEDAWERGKHGVSVRR